MSHHMSRGRKVICLVDFRVTGHHPLYLSHFAKAFQSLNYDVDIYTSDKDKCRELLLQALPSLDLTNIAFLHTNAATHTQNRKFGCRSFFKLIELQQEIEHQENVSGIEYELVFFAYLDDITHPDFNLPYIIKTPFTKKFSGLLMSPREKTLERPTFPLNLLLTSIIERKNANIPEVGLLVEDVETEMNKKINRRTVTYPDFCSINTLNSGEFPLVDILLERKKNRLVSSLLGSIRSHKSVDLFLDCIQTADPSKHFFVMAGKFAWHSFTSNQREMIKKIISNPPENLLVHDDWLESEAMFDTIVQVSDILFAYYRGFKKSSNLLTKGAVYKVPVIVSNEYLMGERVRKYELGYSLSEPQVVELYKQAEWKKFEFNETLRSEFERIHSVDRITDIFASLLKLGDAR